jgi:hypothetical protein
MTSVPRRQQSLVAWPGAATLLIRCLSLNAFSGVSPHPHARQVEFREQSLMGTRPILPVRFLLHHCCGQKKYQDSDIAWNSPVQGKEYAWNSHSLRWLPPSRCEQRIVSRQHEAHLITFAGTASCEHALQIPPAEDCRSTG